MSRRTCSRPGLLADVVGRLRSAGLTQDYPRTARMQMLDPGTDDHDEAESARSFREWTSGRAIESFGTNAGSQALPFQTWVRFKEAYSPELVARAVRESSRRVTHCVDPFGGSGTTALTCQFLGIESTTIEVNPFLGDLIAAKLHRYDSESLVRSYATLLAARDRSNATAQTTFADLPDTFVEPGRANRWIYDRNVADELARFIDALREIDDSASHRLFRVLLGGLLLRVSNVTVSGKGRRYRRNWESRPRPDAIASLVAAAAKQAFVDIHRFRDRPSPRASLAVSDARTYSDLREFDLAVFSPPYPNSFDYTDVYNVELWTLGYLTSGDDNRALRQGTLSSHVQLYRDFPPRPETSASLLGVLDQLDAPTTRLWSPWIPAMIGGYFADLALTLRALRELARPKAQCWIVVGESMYAGIRIETGKILTELAPATGWKPERLESLRTMRSSAQHGGQRDLAEDLVVLGVV